jgi:hypothetical protein
VPRILQPAIHLESLEISREIHSTLDISKLATYPRLAVLSLSTFIWDEGTAGQGDDIMRFPAEDLIVRHRMTLKKLELYNCRIRIERSTERPFRSWADVYDRLAEVLTELVELWCCLRTTDTVQSTTFSTKRLSNVVVRNGRHGTG